MYHSFSKSWTPCLLGENFTLGQFLDTFRVILPELWWPLLIELSFGQSLGWPVYERLFGSIRSVVGWVRCPHADQRPEARARLSSRRLAADVGNPPPHRVAPTSQSKKCRAGIIPTRHFTPCAETCFFLTNSSFPAKGGLGLFNSRRALVHFLPGGLRIFCGNLPCYFGKLPGDQEQF